MDYPELTLKQKTAFLSWATKEMTKYTVICIMFDEWYYNNIFKQRFNTITYSDLDCFYCMVSFPELIEAIIVKIIKQGGDVILKHYTKTFSVTSLITGKLDRGQYRKNLLNQVKKQINRSKND